MASLNGHDLSWCAAKLPRAVAQAMKEYGPAVFVAGGYIRSRVTGEAVNDIDLFTTDKMTANSVIRRILQIMGGNFTVHGIDESRLHTTDYAITIKGSVPAVQIIHRWTFDSPSACIDSFDFTIAQAAIWWDPGKVEANVSAGWRGICAPDFYPDLAARRLIYTCPVRDEEPGGSMLRVLKFYQKGYKIPVDSLAKVIARLNTGVIGHDERLVAGELTKRLREVDPAYDPDHLSHLPALS